MAHQNPYYRNPGEDWSKYWQPGVKWTRNPSFSDQPKGRKQPRRLFRHSPFMQRHPQQTRIDMHMIGEGGGSDPIFKSPRIPFTQEMRDRERARQEALRNWIKRIPFVGGLLD